MTQSCEAGHPFAVALLDHQMPHCDGAELGRKIIADERLKSTRLILLTSSGQRGDGPQFAEMGFAGYLLKPVAQRDLVDCLLIVLAAKAEEWHCQTQPIVTRHDLRALRAREKQCVLVADDNGVNQRVALRMLEKLGYQAEVANNGKEAITAWETGRYELILMDCQMPEMDGYEATREIRQRERGERHVPIIALTAHAMNDAAIQCKAAGMDDYLSKPIDRERLEACLERFLASERAASLEHRALSPSFEDHTDHAAPIDWAALRVLSDGDPEFERELISTFINSATASLKTILQALASNDLAAVAQTAHRLRGASANLQATAACQAAADLEAAVRSSVYDEIAEKVNQLRQEVQRAIEYLERVLTSPEATEARARRQNSSNVCQSRPLRARRDASIQNTAPTCPSHNTASSRSKPGRCTPPPERPRSSSMTVTSVQPSARARSDSAYWRRWLSKLLCT
jgi:CheY-like chemotaxis protein